MGLTIGAVGDGASRRHLLQLHGLGLVLAALTVSVALFLIGTLLRPIITDGQTPLTVVAVAVLTGWAIEVLTGRGLAVPRSHWQVPEQWRRELPGAVTAGAFGYLLGLGFLTNVMLPSFWVLVGCSLLSPSLLIVVSAWLIYEGGRYLTTVRATREVGCQLAVPGVDTPRGALTPPFNWLAEAGAVVVLGLAAVALLVY